MFKWFTKKEEKIEQTVESVNITHPLMDSVEKILNKTNLSPKNDSTDIRNLRQPGPSFFEYFLTFYIETLDTTKDLFTQTKERLL